MTEKYNEEHCLILELNVDWKKRIDFLNLL